MLIGLSLSRCVKDIVKEKVNVEDVLVIIARTRFDPKVEEQWSDIWEGYSSVSVTHYPEWTDLDEEKVRNVVLNLWNEGKIHQPRNFGAYPRRLNYYWLEAILPISEMENLPSIKKAWDQFQILAGLNNISIKEKK
jgi:hypothetical protein